MSNIINILHITGIYLKSIFFLELFFSPLIETVERAGLEVEDKLYLLDNFS